MFFYKIWELWELLWTYDALLEEHFGEICIESRCIDSDPEKMDTISIFSGSADRKKLKSKVREYTKVTKKVIKK